MNHIRTDGHTITDDLIKDRTSLFGLSQFDWQMNMLFETLGAELAADQMTKMVSIPP